MMVLNEDVTPVLGMLVGEDREVKDPSVEDLSDESEIDSMLDIETVSGYLRLVPGLLEDPTTAELLDEVPMPSSPGDALLNDDVVTKPCVRLLGNVFPGLFVVGVAKDCRTDCDCDCKGVECVEELTEDGRVDGIEDDLGVEVATVSDVAVRLTVEVNGLLFAVVDDRSGPVIELLPLVVAVPSEVVLGIFTAAQIP